MNDLINEIISFWKQNPIYPFSSGILVYGILPTTLSDYFKSFSTVLVAISVILLISIVHSRINTRRRKHQREAQRGKFTKPFEKSYKGLIISISMINDKYLFDWNKALEDNFGMLIRFLKNDHGIDWTGDAKITRSDAHNAISIEASGHDAIKIMIDSENGKGNLNIGNEKIIALKVKKENEKINIYSDATTEIKEIIAEIKKSDTEANWEKLYDVRGIGPAFRAIKLHVKTLEMCWMLYTDQSIEGRKLVEYFIRKMGYTFHPDPVLIEKPFDMKYVHGKINELYTNEVRKVGMAQTDVIADVTGGTTPMSGAILLARTSDRGVQYLDQGIFEVINVKPV